MSALADIGQELGEFVSSRDDFEFHQVVREFTNDTEKCQLDDEQLHTLGETGLFNEWFWLEYRLPKEKCCFLQSFANQATDLTPEIKRLLDQFLATNRFAFWRVGEAIPGNLELIDIKRGSHYRIREFSLTKQVRANDCLFLRVALQDDHWEIVSADGMIPVNLPDFNTALELANELGEPVSIKESLQYHALMRQFKPQDEPKIPETSQPRTLKEARANFDAMLSETGIGKYVSRETIERHMRAELSANNLPYGGVSLGMRLLIGLADNHHNDNAYMGKVLSAGSGLWNALRPLKFKLPRRSKPQIDTYKIELRPWQDTLNEAHEALQNNNYRLMAAKWDEVFAAMLAGQYTTVSLYRYYANAAMAHSADGEAGLGKRLNDIALELCPNYDFGLAQKKRIEDGEYVFNARARSRGKKAAEIDDETFDDNPCVKYYDWFKTLGIDLSAGDGEDSTIRTYSTGGEEK